MSRANPSDFERHPVPALPTATAAAGIDRRDHAARLIATTVFRVDGEAIATWPGQALA